MSEGLGRERAGTLKYGGYIFRPTLTWGRRLNKDVISFVEEMHPKNPQAVNVNSTRVSPSWIYFSGFS